MENKVLVVDDEKEIRELLSKALLRMAGLRVELAEKKFVLAQHRLTEVKVQGGELKP